MQVDYSATITAMVVVGALLTGAVLFVLSRPSDLDPERR
jgi:hypothetical protein